MKGNGRQFGMVIISGEKKVNEMWKERVFSGGHQSVIMVSIWWVWQTGCGMECECGKCVDEELLELVGGFQVVGWLAGSGHQVDLEIIFWMMDEGRGQDEAHWDCVTRAGGEWKRERERETVINILRYVHLQNSERRSFKLVSTPQPNPNCF